MAALMQIVMITNKATTSNVLHSFSLSFLTLNHIFYPCYRLDYTEKFRLSMKKERIITKLSGNDPFSR